MKQDLICEFIDVILSAVESGKLDHSEAREYLLKAITIAAEQQKNLEIYLESAIRDVACS